MKKIFTLLFAIILLAGCSNNNESYDESSDIYQTTLENTVVDMEYTMVASFGERVGLYSGEVIDGIPNGSGVFISETSDGVPWTHTGEFNEGQFHGYGSVEHNYENVVTKREGQFRIGLMTEGKFYVNGILVYEGEYVDGNFPPLVLESFEHYRGEWKEKNSKTSTQVFINDWMYTSVHYSYEHQNEVSGIYTFYLKWNDDGSFSQYNSHGQEGGGVYSIDDNGDLFNVDRDEVTIYEKVSETINIPILKEEPQIGMTKEQVYASTWGYPNNKNETITSGGVEEQWVYDDRGYIYFNNDKVTTIQKR